MDLDASTSSLGLSHSFFCQNLVVCACPYAEARQHVVGMGFSTRPAAKRLYDGTGHGRNDVLSCVLGMRLEAVENVRRSDRRG